MSEEDKYWIISYTLMFFGAICMFVGFNTEGGLSRVFYALSYPIGLTSGLAAGCTKRFKVFEEEEADS